MLYVWTMCIIYCLLFILQACSDKWLCNSRRKDTLLMMTKLFAWSASLSRRLLNSGHLLHFLCCTICTMHLLQIFRPKLPIIEPQIPFAISSPNRSATTVLSPFANLIDYVLLNFCPCALHLIVARSH